MFGTILNFDVSVLNEGGVDDDCNRTMAHLLDLLLGKVATRVALGLLRAPNDHPRTNADRVNQSWAALCTQRHSTRLLQAGDGHHGVRL